MHIVLKLGFHDITIQGTPLNPEPNSRFTNSRLNSGYLIIFYYIRATTHYHLLVLYNLHILSYTMGIIIHILVMLSIIIGLLYV